MAPVDAHQFIAKWRNVALKERSASQEHFLDLCRLLDHPTPAELDPVGDSFTFERGAAKHGGGDGWADVWKKGFFAWEYKGRHADLRKAYDQLLLYREDLENPPLLVVSDMDRIVIRTNFTATPTKEYEIPLADLDQPESLRVLHALFHNPEQLRPGVTSNEITAAAAGHVAEVAQSMRNRGLDPHQVARFLDRVVFCLFAEDVNLLREGLFTELVRNTRHEPRRFCDLVGQLFAAMARGGHFVYDEIRHFNGNLFSDAAVLEPTVSELASIYEAAILQWSAVSPSIFGTLFERGMDPAKRSQLGAHYTSEEDISTLIEPVVMQPLRREWAEVREIVGNLLTTGKKRPADGGRPANRKKAVGEAGLLVHRFLTRLGALKVLDPACGSGNFLYVTLRKLKDLEKEVLLHAQDNGLGAFLPLVGPWQLYGIELNPYAHDLAQMSVWIGYLQWTRANGFQIPQDPVLRAMDKNFLCMDAILDAADPANPKEPQWPRVDSIVGNPPFLGDKLMRRELGDGYVDRLRKLYDGRIPGQSDLCCYWFEKARAHLAAGGVKRAGQLATQSIRGGANRRVLERIKDTGGIFFAESDRPWILDGANVHVSMVGFDDGTELVRVLDGICVDTINADLTCAADRGAARGLRENVSLSFIGASMHGPFAVDEETAMQMLHSPNPDGHTNSDVVRQWVNGMSITRNLTALWIVDYPPSLSAEEAALYADPFEHVITNVKPVRDTNRRAMRARNWWLLGDPQKAMREAVVPLSRYIGTARVAKHRLFIWFGPEVLPTDQVVAFARSDDYFFGVLHSRLHEVWALAQGTQLREKESGFRYTPTTCFETFPFPWAPGREPAGSAAVQRIAEAAERLNTLRETWLNPPEWTRSEILEFPGTVGGPWDRYIDPATVTDRGAFRVGTVRYPRRAPRDAACAVRLKKRTLTNLYNERPTWLANAHRELDEAVCAAYAAAVGGEWRADLPEDDILANLLALNLERASD